MESNTDLKMKKKQFRELYNLYVLCKISLLANKNGNINNHYFKNLDYKSVVLIIEAIISQLNEDEKRIFTNTFIKKTSNYQWWKNYYSKSTYYRLQKNTIEKVLFLIQTTPEVYNETITELNN